MTTGELWKKFDELVWWKQALCFIPLLVLIVFLMVLGRDRIPTTTSDQKPADSAVKKNQKDIKALAKEAAKVAGEIAAMKTENDKRNEEADRELEKDMARIDAAADADELVRIAAELRRRRDEIANR